MEFVPPSDGLVVVEYTLNSLVRLSHHNTKIDNPAEPEEHEELYEYMLPILEHPKQIDAFPMAQLGTKRGCHEPRASRVSVAFHTAIN